MSRPVITVENLGKRYRIGEQLGYRTLRETIQHVATAPFRRLFSRNGHVPSTSNQQPATFFVPASRSLLLPDL